MSLTALRELPTLKCLSEHQLQEVCSHADLVVLQPDAELMPKMELASYSVHAALTWLNTTMGDHE